MAFNSETFTLKLDDIPLATNGIDQPTFFADNIRGTIVTPEVVKLNLVAATLEAHKNGVVHTHVATVIVPRSQIRAWVKFLNDVADQNDFPPLPEEPVAAANGKT